MMRTRLGMSLKTLRGYPLHTINRLMLKAGMKKSITTCTKTHPKESSTLLTKQVLVRHHVVSQTPLVEHWVPQVSNNFSNNSSFRKNNL